MSRVSRQRWKFSEVQLCIFTNLLTQIRYRKAADKIANKNHLLRKILLLIKYSSELNRNFLLRKPV